MGPRLRDGVVREDIDGQLLAKMGVDKERMALANSGVSLAKMLQANRIDLWAYGAPVIMYVGGSRLHWTRSRPAESWARSWRDIARDQRTFSRRRAFPVAREWMGCRP